MRSSRKIYIFILSMLAVIEGIAMLPCAICGSVFGEPVLPAVFLIFGLILIVLGAGVLHALRRHKYNIRQREGYLIGAMVWIASSVIAAVPFIAYGYSPVDSLFETIAAFTTTGCTVISYALMPKSLILWKAVCNWLGGMGILVLLTWVFPALGISGQLMASVESSGPMLQRFDAKYALNGKYLYLIYIALTAAEFLLLVFHMGPYEAFVNTFTSISTAGLVRTAGNATMLALPYVRVVIAVFTVLSSLNFAFYLRLAFGGFRKSLEEIEVRLFLIIIAVSTVLIGADLVMTGTDNSVPSAFFRSLENVISFASTSGYSNDDLSAWPTFCMVILFTLLIIGGCTMSTAGSLKVVRALIMYKLIHRSLYQQVHPQAIKAVVVRKKALSSEIVSKTTTHIIMYFMLFFVGALLLSFNGFNIEITLTTALSAFSNSGIAIPAAGSVNIYESFNGLSKVILSFLMITGRLEMYSILLLFSRRFWQQDKVKAL